MWAQSPIEIGKIVASARRHRQLTQAQLAAALGVTQAWVSQIEKGKDNAQLGKVLRVLSYLGIRLKVGEAPWQHRVAVRAPRISLSDVIQSHTDRPRRRRSR